MAITQTPQTNTEDGKPNLKFSLVDLPKILFDSEPEGEEVNADDCSDEEFKEFISRYLIVVGPDADKWPLEDRRDALNFLLGSHQIKITELPYKFEYPRAAYWKPKKSCVFCDQTEDLKECALMGCLCCSEHRIKLDKAGCKEHHLLPYTGGEYLCDDCVCK
jgi:hypothetical protein